MATQEQIETLLEQLEQAPPSAHFQSIDKSTAGIQAILKYLSEADEQVTAGDISEHLGVSTARVAVLLKKMETKGLIERKRDSVDGRVVLVRLTEQGQLAAKEMRDGIYRSLGEMIDRVGMDRMLEFAAISNEIHTIMNEQQADGSVLTKAEEPSQA